jgi:hypothetical protein
LGIGRLFFALLEVSWWLLGGCLGPVALAVCCWATDYPRWRLGYLVEDLIGDVCWPSPRPPLQPSHLPYASVAVLFHSPLHYVDDSFLPTVTCVASPIGDYCKFHDPNHSQLNLQSIGSLPTSLSQRLFTPTHDLQLHVVYTFLYCSIQSHNNTVVRSMTILANPLMQ